MTIESEIAGLTQATTNLLQAVTVSKSLLDRKVSEAAAQADLAATNGSKQVALAKQQADLATTNGAEQVALATIQARNAMTQAGIASIKADESAAFAVASQASANGAASAVYSQLQAVKTQTEAARDAAIAGLGAADNSMALADLLGGISYATDMALHLADLVAENQGTQGSTDRAELYAYMFTELIGKIGTVARAISGGTVALQGGTAAIPSLTSATDVTAGVFFPAAGVVALTTAALERLRVTADGRLGIGTTTPSGLLDVADNKLRVRTAQTPASATAAGNQGEIAWDANYLYVAVATNSWKRAALASW